MALYQTIVTDYPSLAIAGESHNNARHTSIYHTSINKTNEVKPGIGQVVTEIFDHTRWETEDPSAANIVVPRNRLVIVNRDRTVPNNFVTNRIGQTTTTTETTYPVDCLYRSMERGVIYVVVEKEIDPQLPVFVRVANPDASGLQGIGFFTDTADGANTVEVDATVCRDTYWYGVDSATYIAAKDPNVTPVIDRDRIGLATGYAVAPLAIRYA